MNMKRFPRFLALLCVLALSLCGCAGKAEDSAPDSMTPGYSPTVPDSVVDPSVPGSTIEGSLGTPVDYGQTARVTLEKALRLRPDNSEVLLELSIRNLGQDPLDCSALVHFTTLDAQGNDCPEILGVLTTLVHAQQYYAERADSTESFNSAIGAGETVRGYLCVTPGTQAWEAFTLVYMPRYYYNNDRVLFRVTPDDLEDPPATSLTSAQT